MKLMELNHNIGFSIGDYCWDGHCLYQEYHIVSNYSGEEISKAYQELSSELGWNFLAECRGYEEQCLTKEGEQHLLKLGIISESDILASKEEWYGDTYAIENSDEFVDIFFKLVKIKIPDLVWDYRDLNEESIHLLDGAGYGLLSN